MYNEIIDEVLLESASSGIGQMSDSIIKYKKTLDGFLTRKILKLDKGFSLDVKRISNSLQQAIELLEELELEVSQLE